VLHTRVTARRSSCAKRSSRNILLTMCSASLLAALAACGSDSTTGPAPDLTGDYALQSVDGKAPPDTVLRNSDSTIVFLDGMLSLHSDKSYKLLFHITTTTSSGTIADSSGSTGTYSVSGNTVNIRNTSNGGSVVATAALPTISFVDNGETFVFSK